MGIEYWPIYVRVHAYTCVCVHLQCHFHKLLCRICSAFLTKCIM